MIKVIASDLDGTLLDENHELNIETLRAVEKAQAKGIRFMVATGRGFGDAMIPLSKHELLCDYIVASGAEVRNPESRILKRIPMDPEGFEKIFERVTSFPVAIKFCSNEYDYMIGTKEEVRSSILAEARLFHVVGSDEEVLSSELFCRQLEKIRCINSVSELKQSDITVYKIFISSADTAMIKEIDKTLVDIPNIVSASSFASNLELSHIKAQKGLVLKEYIENLGYKMSEVMVLGDSMNDYSMLSMDFGMTVAMENAMDEIKEVAKYITKPNTKNGVAHAIYKMLDGKSKDLKKNN